MDLHFPYSPSLGYSKEPTKNYCMKFLMFLAIAFLPFTLKAQSSSGIYLPVVSSPIVTPPSVINMIAQPAHYMKIDSQVVVYGTIFANGFPTVGHRYSASISVPFPNSILAFSAYGVGTVYQSTNGTVQANIFLQSGKIFIGWSPTSSNPANIFYHFIYSISP